MRPEDFKREIVWDDDGDERRIVIVEYEDGTCQAVDSLDEQRFYDRQSFNTVKWPHHKPIPQKKKRLMTRDECMIWAVTEGYKDWVVAFQAGAISLPSGVSYTCPIEDYKRAKITDGKIGEWKKFEVEE